MNRLLSRLSGLLSGRPPEVRAMAEVVADLGPAVTDRGLPLVREGRRR